MVRAMTPPPAHREFLETALPRLQRDSRIVGVAAAGSWMTGSLDEFSDLDLVVAIEPTQVDAVMADRMAIAAGLGHLLAAFTGEHINEPKLLICLYGSPLLHVDLKFGPVGDLTVRDEDPVVLWEREGALTRELGRRPPRRAAVDLQWIEDRFWVWLHYGATKAARGEVFEAIDVLGFLRAKVLGPLALLKHGNRPYGVRRVETLASAELPALVQTIAGHDARGCAVALRAAATLYRRLRESHATPTLIRRTAAEAAALEYVDRVIAALPSPDHPRET